jgi:DNA-binding LacI/PurR family transcriptional regulator
MSTIIDVAKLSGVSTQTVSRVINNHPYVSNETRIKVEDAIRKLGYRPNLAARALSNGKTNTLGVVSWDTTLYGPASTIHAVQTVARDHGFNISLYPIRDLTLENLESAIDEMKYINVDGFLLNLPLEIELESLKARFSEIKTLLIENENAVGLPTVNVDQYKGAKLAVDHLVEMGHEHIAHIAGPSEWFDARNRMKGWKDSLIANALSHQVVVSGDWSARSGYEAMRKILKNSKRTTAVFAANDAMALGALKYLYENDVNIPNDLSLIGFDDIPEAQYFVPGLSTVQQDFEELGRKAIEMLVDFIKNDVAPPAMTLIEPKMMKRQSVNKISK